MKKQQPNEGLPTIQVQYTKVASRFLFYPVNQFGIDLAQMMKRKSFTKKELEKLQGMGFSIEVTAVVPVIPEQFR